MISIHFKDWKFKVKKIGEKEIMHFADFHIDSFAWKFYVLHCQNIKSEYLQKIHLFRAPSVSLLKPMRFILSHFLASSIFSGIFLLRSAKIIFPWRQNGFELWWWFKIDESWVGKIQSFLIIFWAKIFSKIEQKCAGDSISNRLFSKGKIKQAR